MCRNCSKVANLKWLKLGLVHYSPASLAPEREKCCVQNNHPYVGNSLGVIIFELLFELNFDLPSSLVHVLG